MGFSLGDIGKALFPTSIGTSSILGGLGGGPKTQKTMTDVPAWLRPYVKFQAEEAQRLYNEGGPLIGGPNPLLQESIDQTRNVAGGDFMNQIQPSLQNSFNQAYQNVNSQFAMGGRRGGALDDAAIAEGFSRGATPLINAERDRQYNAIRSLPGLGALQQEYETSLLRQPYDRFSMFQQGLPTGMGSVTSQPLYRNPLSSILGGATTGAAIGGPWGGAIGAGVGLLGSYT